MCHIALILPLLALPLLWIWPLAVAGPIYAVIALVSAAIYWYAVRAMRRPVETGVEAMIGATGRVVGSHGTTLVLQIGGELWNGRSAVVLRDGDRVKVIAVERLVLVVERADTKAASARSDLASLPGQRFTGA